MISITVNGTDYDVPSSAADTNWAAKQVAFEQAVAEAANDGIAAANAAALAVLEREKLLSSNITPAPSDGSTDQSLMSYAMPGSTLADDGDVVRVTAWGTTDVAATGAEIKLNFGGTTLLDTALTNSQVNRWRIIADVVRSGAALQVASASIVVGGTISVVDCANASPAETLSDPVTIELTATTNNADDVTQLGMLVELLPAP